MTIHNNNNNLSDPTYTNVNRLFVLSYERIEENNVKKKTTEILFHIILYQKFTEKTSMS